MAERNISLILAEKLLRVLEESGATEIEKLAAIEAARAIVPVERGSLSVRGVEPELPEPS